MTDTEIVDAVQERRVDLSDVHFDSSSGQWMYYAGYNRSHNPDASVWEPARTFREAVESLLETFE